MMPVRVNAKVRLDNTGTIHELPVIITAGGILKSHLKYLIHYRSRSDSWINRSAFAVSLLIEFWEANQDSIADPKRIFREFALSLYTGTVGEGGNDPSNLRWIPRREADARQLVGHITHYCDWLADANENEGLRINPKIKPDSVGKRMNLAAFYHRKRNAFLSHLVSKKLINNQRYVHLPHLQTYSDKEAVKFFPEGRMGDLLSQGFVRRGYSGSQDVVERLNLRDILITMLMAYGGLRISECFHIWLSDITLVDDHCIVKVHHPSQGIAPDGISSRAAYLKERYDLLPRNEYPKKNKLHAGWKSPALSSNSGKYFVVYWFPLDAGEKFRRLWSLYLKTQYIHPKLNNQHPYAFTSQDGSPYSIKAYTANRKRAVERIGLNYCKDEGTTPHGDRHSYGQALAITGVRPEIIQKLMHHKNQASQSVYTVPADKEIRRVLEEAEKNASHKARIELERFYLNEKT